MTVARVIHATAVMITKLTNRNSTIPMIFSAGFGLV